jgi:hypothetical protein
VDVLDKIGGAWAPDGDGEPDGGVISAASCLRYGRGARMGVDGGVEPCGPGFQVFVGRCSADRWRDNDRA